MTEGFAARYWDAARGGRLVLQRCGRCGRVRHYPQPLCPACHSFAVDEVTASGAGTVHSWTVAHHAFGPEVRDQLPYVLVTVDLAEGVRMLGRLAEGHEPSVGLPVTLAFVPAERPGPDPGEPARPLPVFTPAAARN